MSIEGAWPILLFVLACLAGAALLDARWPRPHVPPEPSFLDLMAATPTQEPTKWVWVESGPESESGPALDQQSTALLGEGLCPRCYRDRGACAVIDSTRLSWSCTVCGQGYQLRAESAL